MKASIQSHIRANVIGYVALFFSLSLGTAWALEANSVKSKHIVNGQVKGKDTKKSQVQARVDETCSTGRSIRAIGEDGSVTCETVGGGGSPTGPAGGDLAGSSYPNPLIASGAVNSAKVANDSLTGFDINESSLGAVAMAAQGGTGRYGYTGSCNPNSTTYVACSTVAVPHSRPGRLLIIAQVIARSDFDPETASGNCQIELFESPIEASRTGFYFHDEDDERTNASTTLIAVSDVLPAGTQTAGVACNEFPDEGPIFYPHVRMVGVSLSDG